MQVPKPTYCLLLCCLAGAPIAATAQVLTNNGATITVAAGGSLTVKGDVTNAAGATITNAGAVTITGNTVNNGAFTTAAAGTLTLQGSSAQTLGGATAINARDVVVNNAAGITLSAALNVDGAMTFTSGIITAANSSYPVTFTANGTVANTPTDASHINGYVQKKGTGAFTFPVGDAARYQPIGANLSANAGGMTARYYAADAGTAPYGAGGSQATPLLYYNKAEYWELSPATTATGTVTIYYDAYNNTGINSTADLRVAHKSGGQYLNEGGTATGTTASGSVTSNSISTFSPFTLGSVSANSPLTTNPLPVTLVQFTGMAEAACTRLDWKTATEAPGTLYTIERSAGGAAFEPAGTVAGKGGAADYTFYDRQPSLPVAYYRLKLAGQGGSDSYSPVIVLHRNSQYSGQVTLAPVPATGRLTITNTNTQLNGTPAAILDMQGREVYRFTMQPVQETDVAAWPAGNYILRLADGTMARLTKL